MDYLDILFFAVLAVLFLSRLWTILGRKDDQDEGGLPPLDNPFAEPKKDRPEDGVVILQGRARDAAPSVLTEGGHAMDSLAGGLDRLAEMDPSFNEKQFLDGAKMAFRMIIEAFAHGDLASVERLLAPPVLASFKQGLSPDASPASPSRLVEIKDAVLTAVRLDGARAHLTVAFTSVQNPPGLAGQSVVMHDHWVFSRVLSAEDPNWQLVATTA